MSSLDNASRKKINFADLVTEFKGHYSDFDEAINAKAVFAEADNQPVCYVTFGITNAGKSTTIARLTSDLTPEEFMQTIENREGDNERYCEISGIAIGHLATSTTVVPKIYTVNREHFCDMPGFAEHNPQKKVIIDILQKCFLTRVRNTKLMVVVEMDKVFEDNVITLIKHYHEPLEQLFGDQYRNAIKHFFFVLTKNSDPDMTSSKIKFTMLERSSEINEESYHGALFLNRLGQRHVIVDLEEEGREELQAKIFGMISAEKTEADLIKRHSPWSIERLEASGNILNQMCLEHMNKQVAALKAYIKRFRKLQTSAGIIMGEMTKTTEVQGVAMKAAIDDLRTHHQRERRLSKEIDLYHPTKVSYEQELRHLEDLQKVHEKQNDLFNKHFVAKGFVEMRCDISAELPSKRKRDAPKYHLKIVAHLHGFDGVNRDVERLILIMEYEEHDNALRDIVKRGGSVIPASLKDIRLVTHKKLIYNSHSGHNPEGCVHEATGEVLSLELTRAKPFKVYTFVERPFRGTDYFDEFKTVFAAELREDEAKAQSLQQQIEQLGIDHEKNKRERKEAVRQVARARKEVEGMKKEVISIQTVHREKCDNGEKHFSDLLRDLDECKGSDIVSNIKHVDRIFRENSIQTDLSKPLEDFVKAFPPLEKEVNLSLEELKAFLDNDSEKLSTIIAQDTSDVALEAGSVAGTVDTASSLDLSSVSSA